MMLFVMVAVFRLDIVVRRSRNDREQVIILGTFFARCAAFMGGDIPHIAAAAVGLTTVSTAVE